ncbi:hypothetical protein RIF29_40566 [Crotalaria pallida]|uniref:MSP domain-containing protein n=1 Tax=Crotalaria pallida TaxID=3830 RepID=A0AAN9HRT3_CROPI
MAPTFTELLKIEPHELTFVFELNKQSSCLLHLSNTTPHYVAFKVKTTSPKKYIVNPNNGIIKPHITCDLTVTMQAQSTPLPVDFSCKDKFLIQSTIVPLGSTEDCISSDLFVKDNGKYVEEKKVRVVLNTQPSCPDPELCPEYRDLKHESSNRIYVLKDKDKVAEENGLETAKDIEEDRKDEDVFPGCNENVVDRKQESDSVQLNLAKDFEELKSKLSIMDSKLREAEETIVKLNEEKLKDNLKAEGTILKLNEEKRKDNLEKYFLKQELELSSALTPEPLDGTNYVEWSLNAQNKIRGRKRWGYVSGTKPAPKDKKSEEYETWEDEDCMVKSWLLDSMTKDIRSLFIRLTTAKEIWDTAKETYLGQLTPVLLAMCDERLSVR